MAITNKTNRDLLEEVKQAISAILTTGQSYTIGSRSLTRADLDKLINWRTQLETEIAAEENRSPLLDNTYVGFFNGR